MDLFAEEFNVKQKDHFDWMKTSLIELASSSKYWDLECICSDGRLKTNRFYVGMIFPQITDQATALLPDYSVKEITGLFKTIFNNLSHIEGYNDTRYNEISEPEPQDPLALNPADIRKITPHIDPIDPGSHMSMHFLEEQTNMYTAQPQPQLMPQPLPKVLKISKLGTQDFQVHHKMPTMAPNQVIRPSVGQQPLNVIPGPRYQRTLQPVNNFAPPKNVIYIDQNGKRLTGPIVLQSIQGPGKPFNTVNAQTVRFPGFPGNGTTSNPRMPTFPKQPVNFKNLSNSVRHPFKPASSGDEILVAKASEDPLAFLTTKSSSGSLLNASSFKKTQSQNNDREGIFDSRGILIGYKNADPGYTQKYKIPSTSWRPEKRKAEEILVPDEFSDDDTIETLESGVLYLVNSQRARVMKPKIKCKKVKITAEQMERIRAQEQEESIMQNTSKVTFDGVVTLS